MKEFLLVFREARDLAATAAQPSVAEIEAMEKVWADWMGSIAAQNKYVGGVRPGSQGKTVKAGKVVTDGPYAEVKEIILGTITVKAESIDEAVEIAYGCPSLLHGGNVEVRDIISM